MIARKTLTRKNNNRRLTLSAILTPSIKLKLGGTEAPCRQTSITEEKAQKQTKINVGIHSATLTDNFDFLENDVGHN